MANKDHARFRELVNMSPAEIRDASKDLTAHERTMSMHALHLLKKKPGADLSPEEAAILKDILARIDVAGDGGENAKHLGFANNPDDDDDEDDEDDDSPNDQDDDAPGAPPMKPPADGRGA